MAQAGGGERSFWQSVRDLPGRTPLRVKLTAVLLVLVAIALVVISVASVSFLRSYLQGQADSQLSAFLHTPQPGHYVADALNGNPPPAGNGLAVYWDSKGHLTQAVQPFPSYTTQAPPLPGPEVTPGASWLGGGQYATVAATSGTGHWRVVAEQYSFQRVDGQLVSGTIIVGVDFSSATHTLTRLTIVDIIVSALLLALIALAGIGMIRASLRPLHDIEQTAGAIAEGDLSRRVPEQDPGTEVGRLGRSLNTMLSQIEQAFHAQSKSEEDARRSESRMRQFVADASHELRTPLTAIRGFAEYYRQRGGVDLGRDSAGQLPPADLDRIMRRVEQEAARMGVLVEDMLLLARLDQQRPLERRPVDLLTLAADAVQDARIIAPDRSIELSVGSATAFLVLGDEVRLRQVIGNLMSNALTHTPDGTPVTVRILAGPREPVPSIVLEVTDHGPGLSADQADRVFERFYRADQARTRKAGGTGLGLAIVAALVAAHGGTVALRTAPGEGATFRVTLPLAPEAQRDEPADAADDDTYAQG
jgi:two-component system OmpR family sensor kinase